MIKKSSFLQELSVYWQLIDTIYLNAIRLGELIWMQVILYNIIPPGRSAYLPGLTHPGEIPLHFQSLVYARRLREHTLHSQYLIPLLLDHRNTIGQIILDGQGLGLSGIKYVPALLHRFGGLNICYDLIHDLICQFH